MLVVVCYEGCPWQHLRNSPFKAAVRFCFETLPAEFLAIFHHQDVSLISRLAGAKIR